MHRDKPNTRNTLITVPATIHRIVKPRKRYNFSQRLDTISRHPNLGHRVIKDLFTMSKNKISKVRETNLQTQTIHSL